MEYPESEEYPIEREVYSRIVEAVKPYLGNILDDYKSFEIVFDKDKVEMCLKLIKERIENSFQTL